MFTLTPVRKDYSVIETLPQVKTEFHPEGEIIENKWRFIRPIDEILTAQWGGIWATYYIRGYERGEWNVVEKDGIEYVIINALEKGWIPVFKIENQKGGEE